MFLRMFEFIPVTSFLSAAILWTLVFGISGNKKNRFGLWSMRVALALPALLNTLLFISTII